MNYIDKNSASKQTLAYMDIIINDRHSPTVLASLSVYFHPHKNIFAARQLSFIINITLK